MTSSYPLTFYNFVTFNVIFATASVYIALNVAVIGLRLFSSWKRHNRLAMGDWCGLLATLFTLGLAIIMLIGAQTRSIGRHDQNQGDGAEDVQISMIDYKLHFAYNIVFTLAVGFIRLTLLLLFRKLFLHHPLYRTVQAMIALVLVWVACYLVMAFSCGKAPENESHASPYDVTARLCPGFKLGPAAQQKIGFSVALTDCVIDVAMFLLPLYPRHAGVSGTIAWWTLTECAFGNITCNLPIISGYIFQRLFSGRVQSLSTQVVTIGRKSMRLNNNKGPPADQTLDQTLDRTLHPTRAAGAEEEERAVSPSTVEHIELSPLKMSRGQV
ncbi:hypothetical protein PG999_014127 [Apiospora kogelbergensis]|uniref:Rhodopsin domain-containing protein n=1 Tax=Apiospora kogelbergensis TaxID=1337665 RepID=A0AAW0Q955_9PEZI